ncbi:protein unc-13 homolog isoform X2 [Macadamia integrifolia]|uniref:protein unc-13 homolog isoform X2 n=1 Tax=Macadamia integrifolia TaxID=60698 RepID=UPI001C4EBD09|nr:protein unc-13 homolog isoform X2 [Macadamia integrifolia]
MGHQARRDSFIVSRFDDAEAELDWPFGKVEGVDREDLRETAYEIFFTACRSSPGFGGRNAINHYNTAAQESSEGGGGGGGVGTAPRANGGGLVGMSRIKRALGLKTIKRMSPRRAASSVGTASPSSPRGVNSPNISLSAPPPMRPRRPMTSAEIMRQQMRVSEQSDTRLRKTLMRTLVGQMGRRADTIIIPLELLRHLKPTEFNDSHEYQFWQKRQFKILEAGLLLYPSIPVERSNSFAKRLRDIIRASETKTIDTGKNSETLRTLCNCVVSIAWRSAKGSPNDACHWADGYPLNIHLYLSLLNCIFDHKDETLVLDEIDELLELIKKTWSTLGINKFIHNVCFTWVLFQQYVLTSQTEPDLLCASLAMLAEVSTDAKRPDRDTMYMKILSSVLMSMQGWAEKKLLDYHENFPKNVLGLMENVLPLALSTARILEEDVANLAAVAVPEKSILGGVDSTGNRVDYYIRSSLRNAFAKILENVNAKAAEVEVEASEALLDLAQGTEDLATKEKETFSPTLKRWHPIAAGVAAVSLHNCYGTVLKQYLTGVTVLTNETILVLHRAGKLEKVLVQMVVEDSVDCEDGGKAVVREMQPFEVESIISGLLKSWVDDRLKRGKESLRRAKETETWNPKSKTEPYAQSAVELMRLCKETVDEFFDIPIGISDDLLQDVSDGIELLFQDYANFVASCGSKQSYIPALPPLTRCNRGSKFHQFWRKAMPCKSGTEDLQQGGTTEGLHPRPSTSRGTQRLYIRLNTLHYLLAHLHSLDKTLSLVPHSNSMPRNGFSGNRRHFSTTSSSYLDLARSSIQTATQHVSEVAAFRLIFLDSKCVFYESLYVGDVVNARIRPALRTLKQNLTLLAAILTDRAQPLALKEVMRASFEAYLMVLLAGGSSRVFSRMDHDMIVEDFESLKRIFCTCGEGLVAENVVEKESETVEGVVALMGQSTEQLVEDFSIVACEASGLGVVTSGLKLPMPPTTGRWNRADPNTILRVLCHRNDSTANRFLKRTFQLAKRR